MCFIVVERIQTSQAKSEGQIEGQTNLIACQSAEPLNHRCLTENVVNGLSNKNNDTAKLLSLLL